MKTRERLARPMELGDLLHVATGASSEPETLLLNLLLLLYRRIRRPSSSLRPPAQAPASRAAGSGLAAATLKGGGGRSFERRGEKSSGTMTSSRSSMHADKQSPRLFWITDAYPHLTPKDSLGYNMIVFLHSWASLGWTILKKLQDLKTREFCLFSIFIYLSFVYLFSCSFLAILHFPSLLSIFFSLFSLVSLVNFFLFSLPLISFALLYFSSLILSLLLTCHILVRRSCHLVILFHSRYRDGGCCHS
jgi:hypothetical protein